MELYSEQGFEQTTVAEIAERAGLTERTFFRYFGDKREVLFAGAGAVVELLADAVASAPASATPLEAVGVGISALATGLEKRRGRTYARQRQRIIGANDELRERELIKLAGWASELADALRKRGVPEPTAALAGEIGIAVFRNAFARWVATARGPTLVDLVRASLDEVKEIAA